MIRSITLVGVFLCHVHRSDAFLASSTAGALSSSPRLLLATNEQDLNDGIEHGVVKDSSVATWAERLESLLVASALSLSLLLAPLPAMADGQTKEFKFPPIDFSDKNRCKLNSSSMGQANAARDKLYDLRQCDLAGVDASGFDLSGVIMTKTILSKANLKEAYFSKGYLRDSNFDGADFSNAIVDRASFQGSSLKGALFTNAVLTGTSFDGANVEGADFSEAAIGIFDLRNLCKNPTLQGENPITGEDTRLSAGCK